MGKRAEDYLEYPHGSTEPKIIHWKPTLEEDMQQAEKNMEVAERTRKQLLENTAERNRLNLDGLSKEKKDEEIEKFLYESYADLNSREYLVDGAILTCTNCTRKPVYAPVDNINGITIEKEYHVVLDASIDDSELPDNDVRVFGRLQVTENYTASANGKKHATIKDCVRGKNIPSFGNCLRGPDCLWEKSKLRMKDAENGEGTCSHLMRLESEWENMIKMRSNWH